jgi:molybdenum cofactor biosynthesis protein MoaC
LVDPGTEGTPLEARNTDVVKTAKSRLTHVGADGALRMVDVGAKPATVRTATAEATVRMSAAAHRSLRAGLLKKGDAVAAARIAGITAAKRTADLIPLCHPLSLTHVDVSVVLRGRNAAVITCTTACTGPTGVEMEAMTGACVAALTLYDMCKAVDRSATIESVRLLAKAGGKSGAYRR